MMSGWEIERQKTHSLDVSENNNGWFEYLLGTILLCFLFSSQCPVTVQCQCHAHTYHFSLLLGLPFFWLRLQQPQPYLSLSL